MHDRAECSEYDLLNHLAGEYLAFQGERSLPLNLFRQHFILFHCLYRLQDQLWAEQAGHLEISPLRIRLRDYQPGQASALTTPDPLRSYYLNLAHLAASNEEVNDLLGDFWTRLTRRDNRQAALELLGLEDPVDDKVIMRRYRSLVMTHHPDRGGDATRLQLLNAALADLLPLRRSRPA